MPNASRTWLDTRRPRQSTHSALTERCLLRRRARVRSAAMTGLIETCTRTSDCASGYTRWSLARKTERGNSTGRLGVRSLLVECHPSTTDHPKSRAVLTQMAMQKHILTFSCVSACHRRPGSPACRRHGDARKPDCPGAILASITTQDCDHDYLRLQASRRLLERSFAVVHGRSEVMDGYPTVEAQCRRLMQLFSLLPGQRSSNSSCATTSLLGLPTLAESNSE